MKKLVRPLTLAGAFVLLAALAAACTYVKPPVLTMAKDGKSAPFFTMSWDDLQKKLASASGAGATTTSQPGFYDAATVASALTATVQEEVIKQIIADEKITPNDQDQALAQSDSQQSGSTDTTLTAQVNALQRTLAERAFASGKLNLDDQARQLLEANKASYAVAAQLCISVITFDAVAPTSTQTQAPAPTDAEYAAALGRADKSKAALATESFETVADRDSDLKGQVKGGKIDCRAESALPADVVAAISGDPKGTVTAPIKYSSGYVIVRVDDRTEAHEPTFDEVKDKVRTDVTYAIGKNLINAFLIQQVGELVIDVDPKYGTWDPQQFAVLPPEGAATPTTATTTSTTTPELAPSTTTTAPSDSSTGTTPPGTASADATPPATATATTR